MMLHLRLIGLLAILFFTGGLCKPTKVTEEDYNDDEYPDEYGSVDEEPENANVESTGGPEDIPQIISRPKNIRTYAGSTIVLPCEVVNVDGVAVVWKRVGRTDSGEHKDEELLWSDNLAITAEPRRIVRLPNNTLVIYNATTEDSADRYVCAILTNRQDVKTPEITYKVRIDPANGERPTPEPHDSNDQSPRIRVTPSERVEIKQGQTLVLGCHIDIHPTPKIKWFQKNKRVHGGEETADGNYLTIKNVTRHNAGPYQCLAEIGTDKPPLGVIEVVVQYSPVIEVEGETVNTGINVESELSCIVHAHPRARVMWYKDRREILPRKGEISMKDAKNKHYLKIVHTSNEDLGEYMCRAVNEIGGDSKIITLTGAPSQPTIHSGEMTKSATALKLSWRVESYSPITEYILKYRSKEDNNWTIASPQVTNGMGNQFIAEHTIEGLRPGSYEAILTARNAFGFSQPSVPYTFVTEYKSETSQSVKGSAVTVRPHAAITATLLVVSLCAFISL